MKILLTGFEPFGGESINPAFEILKLLPESIGGAQLIKREIPVSFEESLVAIEKIIAEETPDVVLSLGQSGGAFGLRVERVGLNLRESEKADNYGHRPSNEKIHDDGEVAYYASLPVKAMVKRLREGNVPAFVSYSAGTYVCNNVLYGLLYLNETKYSGRMKCGFIHVPYFSQQIMEKRNTFYMAPEEMKRGIELAVNAILENETDIDFIN